MVSACFAPLECDIIDELHTWKESSFRKPLVLRGARQVGKAWTLREFGHRAYKNSAYVTLEEIAPGIPRECTQFFETTKDPRRIISNVSLALGEPINPGELVGLRNLPSKRCSRVFLPLLDAAIMLGALGGGESIPGAASALTPDCGYAKSI